MHRIGSIPFDMKGDQIALLFVTSQTRGRWILPKGLMKSGETHVEACLRETSEEAGLVGTVLDDFPMTVPINKQGQSDVKSVPVTYYPLLVTDQMDEWPESGQRERHWALLSDASKVVHREDYLALIKQFAALAPFVRKAAAAHRS